MKTTDGCNLSVLQKGVKNVGIRYLYKIIQRT